MCSQGRGEAIKKQEASAFDDYSYDHMNVNTMELGQAKKLGQGGKDLQWLTPKNSKLIHRFLLLFFKK